MWEVLHSLRRPAQAERQRLQGGQRGRQGSAVANNVRREYRCNGLKFYLKSNFDLEAFSAERPDGARIVMRQVLADGDQLGEQMLSFRGWNCTETHPPTGMDGGGQPKWQPTTICAVQLSAEKEMSFKVKMVMKTQEHAREQRLCLEWGADKPLQRVAGPILSCKCLGIPALDVVCVRGLLMR